MPSSSRNASTGEILNFVDGEWRKSAAVEFVEVVNPATAERMGRTPLAPAAEVAQAADAAERALPEWRRTPAAERVQYLFKLKNLLDENLDALSRMITMECGKTLDEARGEMRRVTWPNKAEIYGMTVMVVITTFLFGLYFWGTDQAFHFLVGRILKYFLK